MTDPAFIISFLVLLIFSIYMGFSVGNRVGERALTSRDYWKYNIIAIVCCIVATALLSWVPLLYAVPLGALGGAIAGLKMGFGESVGPWAVHDRVFNVNRKHREAAGDRKSAERRRRKRTGEAASDLMSVASDSKQGDTARSGPGTTTSGKRRRKR